jgi:hypothetical protein
MKVEKCYRGSVKLSPTAVDSILHVISTFDRERGIPHDYHQLKVVLSHTEFVGSPAGELELAAANDPSAVPASLRIDTPLDDPHEARAVLLHAARSWFE